MSIYLTTTFSPAMLGKVEATVKEISLDQVKEGLEVLNWTSAVGHETTADVLSALLGCEVKFNRVNLVLEAGDRLFCVIPNFRANVAREFSREEVEAAGYRCFLVLTRRV
jgi:hypothetical protein